MAQAAIPVRAASQPHIGWFGLSVLVIIVALVAGAVGWVLSENRPKAANADQALATHVMYSWNSTRSYDADTLAADYAEAAVLYDLVTRQTVSGLQSIQATALDSAQRDTIYATTSAPIRTGDFLAWFGTKQLAGDVASPILIITRFGPADGKIVEQWIYPAPPTGWR